MKKLSILTIIILVLAVGIVYADNSVPPLINYQGMLTDTTGQPLSGTKKLTFNIYDTAIGGALIWGPQIFDGVPLINGRFNVILGTTDTSGRSITTAFGANSRFLGITVDSGQELSPRQQILSAPYAIQAERAANAANADLLQNKNLQELTSFFRIPDYDSGWFPVEISNTYVKPLGFNGVPKIVTAYYKLQNGQILLWGLNQYGDGLQVNGILLDFDGNGNLYIRTPDTYIGSNGSVYEPMLVKPFSYRNRTNNGSEAISTSTGVQFRVLVWK